MFSLFLYLPFAFLMYYRNSTINISIYKFLISLIKTHYVNFKYFITEVLQLHEVS